MRRWASVFRFECSGSRSHPPSPSGMSIALAGSESVSCLSSLGYRLGVAVSAGPWYHVARPEENLPALADDQSGMVNMMRRDSRSRAATDEPLLARTYKDGAYE